MQDDEEEDEVQVPCWADMDCTDQCSSSQHASELITALTKASSWQAMLFLSRCHNFGRVCDELGRTALHVAASCGSSPAVMKMLTRYSNLLAQDSESGWTALHRALFYGQLSAAKFLTAVCRLHYFHFWPTVLSVEPLARCVVCRLSVTFCIVVRPSEKVSEGMNRKPGSKSSFFGSPPYFYFQFRLYSHRDGRFWLIFYL